MRRYISLLLLVCFLFSAVIVGPVQAGDENHPEVEDYEGDADAEEYDLISAWLENELNETINAVVQVKTLPPFTPPSQIQNLPTTEYRFYFTVGQGFLSTNYVAQATVPVRGPLGFTIQYRLCTHVYNGSAPGELSSCSSISGRYNSGLNQINFTLQKSDIGSPVEGDLAEKFWSEVLYSQKGDGFNFTEPEQKDRAPDTGFSREKYVFRGTKNNLYRVFLYADILAANATAAKPAEYQITIFNNGSSRLSIDIHNTTGEPWGVQMTPSLINLDPMTNKSVYLKVWPKDLREISNGDTMTVSVWGTYVTLENESKESQNTLTFVTTADLPAPPKKEESSLEQIIGFFKSNMNLIIGLIALIIILAVILKLRSSGVLKRKKKERSQSARKDEDGDDNRPAAAKGPA